MSQLGHFQTSSPEVSMSATLLEAEIDQHEQQVRYGSIGRPKSRLGVQLLRRRRRANGGRGKR